MKSQMPEGAFGQPPGMVWHRRLLGGVTLLKLPLGRDLAPEMICVVLTDAAYDAIGLNAQGAGRWPMQRDRDQCFVQVERAVVNRMRAMRRAGESYSEVTLRLAGEGKP